jgi:LAGLIDADG endonuclease
MAGDNPPGAGNQQERLSCSAWLDRIPFDVGHYVAGFVDGEGSFNVPIRRERDRSLPWRIGLTFNVSQIGPELPQLLRSVFETGTIRGRPDGVYYFEVTRLTELEARVFPFFERFELRGPKKHDLVIFREIAMLVRSRLHLSARGIEAILGMRAEMNRGGKRRRPDHEILARLSEWESSEAIRKAPR